MTDTTNTSAAHVAALAMRDAAAALARRRPLYDGASGEPADEELAQAIEDLPLPDADTTDWEAEAERLRVEVARLSPTEDEIRYTADQDWTGLDGMTAYWLIDRHGDGWAGIGAMMEAWRDAEVRRITAGLTAERNAARLEAQRAAGETVRKLREREAFADMHLSIIGSVLGGPVQVDDIAARLHLLIAERDAALAELAQARERCIADLKQAATTSWTARSQDAALWAVNVLMTPAAAPERADHVEPALRMVSERTEPSDGCSHVAHERGARLKVRSCRCGPDGCADRLSCPRGGEDVNRTIRHDERPRAVGEAEMLDPAQHRPPPVGDEREQEQGRVL